MQWCQCGSAVSHRVVLASGGFLGVRERLFPCPGIIPWQLPGLLGPMQARSLTPLRMDPWRWSHLEWGFGFSRHCCLQSCPLPSPGLPFPLLLLPHCSSSTPSHPSPTSLQSPRLIYLGQQVSKGCWHTALATWCPQQWKALVLHCVAFCDCGSHMLPKWLFWLCTAPIRLGHKSGGFCMCKLCPLALRSIPILRYVYLIISECCMCELLT